MQFETLVDYALSITKKKIRNDSFEKLRADNTMKTKVFSRKAISARQSKEYFGNINSLNLPSYDL